MTETDCPLLSYRAADRFAYDVVYTNVQAARGRGYGATQGIYAVESAVNELAEKMGNGSGQNSRAEYACGGENLFLHMDIFQIAQSCTMDQCMERAKEMMNWDQNILFGDMGNGKSAE